MAMVVDPGGAAIGVWQPGNMKGFDVRSEVGAASWFELHTRDYDKRSRSTATSSAGTPTR